LTGELKPQIFKITPLEFKNKLLNLTTNLKNDHQLNSGSIDNSNVSAGNVKVATDSSISKLINQQSKFLDQQTKLMEQLSESQKQVSN